MSDNNEPANSAPLTPQERNILEMVEDGYSLNPLAMRSALIEKGLIAHNSETDETTLTERGKQVLAAAQASTAEGAKSADDNGDFVSYQKFLDMTSEEFAKTRASSALQAAGGEGETE